MRRNPTWTECKQKEIVGFEFIEFTRQQEIICHCVPCSRHTQHTYRYTHIQPVTHTHTRKGTSAPANEGYICTYWVDYVGCIAKLCPTACPLAARLLPDTRYPIPQLPYRHFLKHCSQTKETIFTRIYRASYPYATFYAFVVAFIVILFFFSPLFLLVVLSHTDLWFTASYDHLNYGYAGGCGIKLKMYLQLCARSRRKEVSVSAKARQ